MNQFIWATRTSGALFVQTNIEPNIICNIIFELILVNSHSNAIYATRNIIKNQDVMLMLEHVHQKMNLQLNKYCCILKKDWLMFIFFFLIVRMNQFTWATRTLGAHFVQKDLEQSNTCNITFELILVKSHSNVIYVTKNSIEKKVVTIISKIFINNEFMNLPLNK